MNIFLSPLAPDVSVSRDTASAYLFSTLRLNLVLPGGVPPTFHGGVHLFMPPTTIEPVPSLSGHANAYRWRLLPRVRRRRASSPQGNSSKGCCLFRYHHGPTNVFLFFPTPTIYYWYVANMFEGKAHFRSGRVGYENSNRSRSSKAYKLARKCGLQLLFIVQTTAILWMRESKQVF